MRKMIWLVLLAATTTIAVAQPNRGDRERRGPRGNMEERFIEVLDLSEDQQQEIKSLRVAHVKAVKENRDALRLKMVSLENEATNESPNSGTIDQLTSEIGALQTKLLKARIGHQIEVRSKLDDEQKIKFDQMHRKLRQGRGKMH